MLPEQSSTIAIEPVPAPKRRMISRLARTAMLASGGSAGRGPIATVSGTGWSCTSVVRTRGWPRNAPSIFSDVTSTLGRLSARIGLGLANQRTAHGELDRVAARVPSDRAEPRRLSFQLEETIGNRPDDRHAGRDGPFGDDLVSQPRAGLAGQDQAPRAFDLELPFLVQSLLRAPHQGAPVKSLLASSINLEPATL